MQETFINKSILNFYRQMYETLNKEVLALWLYVCASNNSQVGLEFK